MLRKLLAALLMAQLAGATGGAALAEPPARPPANAVPVNSFDELSRALFACWAPPPGTVGFEITLRFGLTGKGELRGKPLATYSVLSGPPDLQRAFVAAAVLALSDCTPVLMTEAFARVAAARVLTVRFTSSGRET
ncbi:hypothetical protein V5F34_00060 [Xanthobacter autotrophicus]|uniref:TonB C-terminal domain-containing protein n=1 Tax=Xanthobacter autotrophicus TaxID=280 RepID=A0A6C1K9F4_XANAU|nr:hypothetical protein FBQ73_22400 [Xanthobacter autotrophicus]